MIESVFAGLLILAVLAIGVAGIFVLSRLLRRPERGPAASRTFASGTAQGQASGGGVSRGGSERTRNVSGGTAGARIESTTDTGARA